MHKSDIDKEDREILSLLKDYPAAEPRAGFYDQALARATHEGTRRQRFRWLMTGFGSAVAAGIVLWMISGALFTAPDIPQPEATIPGIALTLEEPRTINLVFASKTALDAATLTVSLPEGIEPPVIVVPPPAEVQEAPVVAEPAPEPILEAAPPMPEEEASDWVAPAVIFGVFNVLLIAGGLGLAPLRAPIFTITENLGTACAGRAWVVVTSQEDIDAVLVATGASAIGVPGCPEFAFCTASMERTRTASMASCSVVAVPAVATVCLFSASAASCRWAAAWTCAGAGRPTGTRAGSAPDSAWRSPSSCCGPS